MKISLINKNTQVEKGVRYLEQYFTNDNVCLNVIAVEDKSISGYKVNKVGDNYEITYSALSSFYKAVGDIVAGRVSTEGACAFKEFGVMLDIARNGVPTVEGLKRYIVNLALTGFNWCGLYMEDVFECDGEPKMGYMRGKMYKTEIKEVDQFAIAFGIELVPYIQTLAHLAKLWHIWDPYVKDCKDVTDILLMGSPRVYELIENMIRTCSETFTSRHLHIGMDEAWLMTCGRYRKEHEGENINIEKVFMDHVSVVCKLCEKYNVKPMAWGDMFVKHCKEYKAPENLTLNRWSYFQQDSKFYKESLDKALDISKDISFASGVCKWVGFAPHNEVSTYPIKASIKACKGRIDNYVLTLWGDDGAECSYNATWYGLLYGVNLAYSNKMSKSELNKLCMFLFGYTYKELLLLDLPNKVFDVPFKDLSNASRYVFFSDVLMGLYERGELKEQTPYFVKNAKTLKRLSRRKSPYAYLYKSLYLLTAVDAEKNCFRNDLYHAYHEGDKKTIDYLANVRLVKITKLVKQFKEVYEEQWHKENKPFGYEVMNIRFGGLLERLEYSRKVLNQYLAGELDKVPALEEVDVSYYAEIDKYNGAQTYHNYGYNVTYGDISWHIQ